MSDLVVLFAAAWIAGFFGGAGLVFPVTSHPNRKEIAILLWLASAILFALLTMGVRVRP